MEHYKNWLSLILAKGIGPETCSKLLSEFNNPESILACDAKVLASFGLKEASIESLLNPDEENITWRIADTTVTNK